jgi:hypothetical protein
MILTICAGVIMALLLGTRAAQAAEEGVNPQVISLPSGVHRGIG